MAKQLNRIPTMEEESELSPVAPFPCAEALGAIEAPPRTQSGMFSRARPRVNANESSPAGVPPETVAAGCAGAIAAADWTSRIPIESFAADQGA